MYQYKYEVLFIFLIFIFLSQNMIYWDDWSEEAILKANKYDGSHRETVLEGIEGIMDLKVFHNASQQGQLKTISKFIA